jgi:hypothetical protein
LDEDGGARRRTLTAALEAYLAAPVTAAVSGDGDDVLFFIVASLALQSTAQFAAARAQLLGRLVAAAVRQRVRQGAGPMPPYDAQAHASLRPGLVLLAIVHLFHTLVLPTPDAAVVGDKAKVPSPVVARMEQLRNHTGAVLGRCRQVRAHTCISAAGCPATECTGVGVGGHRWRSRSKRTFCRSSRPTSFTTCVVRVGTARSIGRLSFVVLKRGGGPGGRAGMLEVVMETDGSADALWDRIAAAVGSSSSS